MSLDNYYEPIYSVRTCQIQKVNFLIKRILKSLDILAVCPIGLTQPTWDPVKTTTLCFFLAGERFSSTWEPSYFFGGLKLWKRPPLCTSPGWLGH